MTSPKVIHVGILGADSTIQTIYLPLLQQTLKAYFSISSIYPAHNTQSFNPDSYRTIPEAPTPEAVITSPSTTLIINALPVASRDAYTISALNAGKHVLVNTPLTLSLPSLRRILEAEKSAPNGARVFVGCARRFAPCFRENFLPEIANLKRIYYARCRNIRGNLYTQTDLNWQTNGMVNTYESEIFDDRDASSEQVMLCHYLSASGCQDLALMQETLGLPEAVSCVSANHPFYSAIFNYTDGVSRGEKRYDNLEAKKSVENGYPKPNHPFTLTYEGANDSIPRNDAHFAIYGAEKSIRIDFGSSALRVVVDEADEEGGLKTTESWSSWEDAYRDELRALYAAVVDGKEDDGEEEGGKTGLAMPTAAKEGVSELKLARMMFRQYDRQCGTIRTPL